MKNKMHWLLAMAVGCVAFGCVPATWAHTTTTNGVTWTYELNGSSATVTAATPANGALSIPAKLDGHSVTAIGDYAFDGCDGLTSVVIPKTVKTIGQFAFNDCANMTNATIGSAVQLIGHAAFSRCFGLTSVTIPASVKKIGAEAFFDCIGLKKFTVKTSNGKYASVGGVLFSKALDTLICFPPKKSGAYAVTNGVKRIADYAFYDCDALTSVTLPDSVETIGQHAFAFADKLPSIKIPPGVKSIGECAFCNCAKLSAVTVDAGNANYADVSGVLFSKARDTLLCFPANHAATTYVVPSSVTSIAGSAFLGAAHLASVAVPSGVKNIGDYAFAYCPAMTSATLAEGVREIGRRAFAYGALASMVVPDSVAGMGEMVFDQCDDLSFLSIPYAFKDVVGGWGQPAACTVNVRQPVALAIATDAELPPAFPFSYYWQPVLARGGTPPYTWTIVDEGEWPEWLDSSYITQWADQNCQCPYLAGVPVQSHLGTCSFTLQVKDKNGKTAKRKFALEVKEHPNREPVIESYSPVSSTVRLEPGDTATFEIAGYDPDGEEVEYAWHVYDTDWNELPGWDVEVDPSFVFRSPAGKETNYIVQASLDDGLWTADQTWTVVVEEKKPLAIAPGSLPPIVEGVYADLNLGVSGGVGPYTVDLQGHLPDGSGLYWPSFCESPGDIVLSGAPDEDSAGTYAVTLFVTDSEGVTVSRTFSLVVEDNPNRCPAMKSFSPTNRYVRIVPGKSVTFKISVSNPDGTALDWSWSVYDSDGIAVTNATSAGSFKFKSKSGKEDVYDVNGTVTDGPWILEQNWRVIAEKQKPLTVSTDNLQAAMEGVYSDIALGVSGGVGPYTLAIDGTLPPGMHYDDVPSAFEMAGLICIGGIPDKGTAGTYKFTGTVTDSEGASVSRKFTLVVAENPNQPPVITSSTPADAEIGVLAGTKLDFTAKASDPEGAHLSYSWAVLDAQSNALYYADNTLSCSWTFQTEGRFSVEFYALDETWEAHRHWTVLVGPQTVWRFYSKAYKGHFFTISGGEKDNLIATNPNWKFEGGAYRAYPGPEAGTVALHRFYSKTYKGHFFTIDETEKDSLIATNPNWNYEGVAYYVYAKETQGTVPVFRFWSKIYKHHFYTIDAEEKDSLEKTNPNWKYEGIAFWALPLEEADPSKGKARTATKAAASSMEKSDGPVAQSPRVPSPVRTASAPWVEVTTSDGTDGDAVVDGDETTGWAPNGTECAWVVLSFREPQDVDAVEVSGENLPEDMRVLLSEDAEEWFEGEGGLSRYVWVAFTHAPHRVEVKEIRLEK
jgi:hypothetical protein